MRTPAQENQALHIGLWVVQALLAVIFVGTGVWKLVTPLPALAAAMPWMGQVAPGFLYLTAVVDLCGGLGIVLPSLTRIKPGLTVLAALGCAAFQACAIVFCVAYVGLNLLADILAIVGNPRLRHPK